jgi:hypothetical protein
MGKRRDAINKPINAAAHYTGMAAAAAGALSTGNAAMGLVMYGTGYGLTRLAQMSKESPNAGGRHSALNDKQFGEK